MLPITDYCKLFFSYNTPQSSSLFYYKGSKEFQFSLIEGIGNNTISFNYRFSNELNFIRLDCSDDAQQRRDTLVSRGILEPPYTNTNDYLNLLKEQMRYWDGKKFVKTEKF